MEKIFESGLGIAGVNCIYDKRKEEDKNEIIEHVPGWASVDSDICSFNTTDELLNIDFVKRWSIMDNFSHYAITVDWDEEKEKTLMAIFDNGKNLVPIPAIGKIAFFTSKSIIIIFYLFLFLKRQECQKSFLCYLPALFLIFPFLLLEEHSFLPDSLLYCSKLALLFVLHY